MPDVAISGVDRDTETEDWLPKLAAARSSFSFRIVVLAHFHDRKSASRAVSSHRRLAVER